MAAQPPRRGTTVIVEQDKGCLSGCLTVFLVLLAIGAAVKFWYLSVAVAVVLAAGLIYQSRSKNVSIWSLVRSWAAASAQRSKAVGSSIVTETENVVIVKQKRGCTCCGTGCVLMTIVAPLSVVGLWEIFGVVVAVAAWPALFAAAHVARRATGHRKTYLGHPSEIFR